MPYSKPVNDPFVLSSDCIVSIRDIWEVAVQERPIVVALSLSTDLLRGRQQLEKKLSLNTVVYGINTGFGGNGSVAIPREDVELHQANLLQYLSAGTGEPFAPEYVRAAQFLTLVAISRGWSAIRPELASALANHLNFGIVPRVPRYGSVGASGDPIPLSYIAKALCGQGEVYYAGQQLPAAEVLKSLGLAPVTLQAKEGLALVNGTRLMNAVASITVARLEESLRASFVAVALVVEALQASDGSYDARIHVRKGHPGQIAAAKFLSELLSGRKHSETAEGSMKDTNREESGKSHYPPSLQEVYSIRCAPQVLGVVVESLESAKTVLEREAISVNDNPLVDPENGDVLYGGNFMGQHLARAMDGLKLDIVYIANLMHSLMALIMDNRFSRGLPNSLANGGSVSQGFKGVQISQTSLVANLRWKCNPASVHTLPTEQYNQDVVTLGLHAAQGAGEMEEQLRNVIAMTMLAACQAIDLRGNIEDLAPETTRLWNIVRTASPKMEHDRPLEKEIALLAEMIVEGRLALSEIGSLGNR